MKKIFWIYVFLIICLIVFSYAFIDVNQSDYRSLYTGIAGSFRLQVSLIYFLIIALLFLIYIFILKQKFSYHFLKKFVVISLLLILSYPSMLSYDIYNYMLTSKLTFFYFENPYVVMPIEIINEPMLAFTHAANKYALYGPFWILLTGIPLLLGLGSLVLTIFTFKIFVALFYLLTIYLIYKLTNSIFPTVFFSLNPLVVIETFLSGHNDIVMMSLCLLAFYMLSKKKIIIAVLLLLSSILIKFATIFIVPLFIYAAIKQVSTERIGVIGFISMFIIFILSALRVEIYPWYAIWFLTFAALATKNKFIYILSISLSFSLLLRYIPYMYLGNHFGITPTLKIILTMLPPAIAMIFYKKNKTKI